MRIWPIAALLAVVTLVAADVPLALGQSSDLVYVSTGTGAERTAPKRGSIVAMTANDVQLETSGAKQTYAVNEIRQIKFADEPTALENARNTVTAKNYNTAISELEKVDASALKREFEKQEVAFLKAYCQAQQAMTEGGDKEAAATALLDFVRATNKNHYRFYQAAETLGDLMLASGKFEDAPKYYGDAGLAAAPWPDYKLRANLALGRALYLGGKFAEALASYEAVLANQVATTETNALKQYAQAGKGACLAETGKVDEGITLVKEVIRVGDPQDRRLFAYASNALGNCYLKAGKPKDARIAFLQTHLLFSVDADTHAEALYHLARLGDTLNEQEISGAARNTLRQQYAGSHWLSKQP